MNVTELIEILKTHNPLATVVIPTYNDRSDVVNVLGLKPNAVRAVELIERYPGAPWLLPKNEEEYGLFEVNEADGYVGGVQLGESI